VTSAFSRQLRWELRRLWRRPRTYLGFVAGLLFQVLLFVLLQLPAVRRPFLQGAADIHQYLAAGEPLSSLSNAVRVAGQTMLFIGTVALALVASEAVAKEVEDGTLRMVFCRPVSRTSVFLQKLVLCIVYTVCLTLFLGATAVMLAVAFEGPGKLVVVSVRESILGVHEFWPGLARYAIAIVLLAASILTVTLVAFTVSCFPVKAATAAAVALIVLLGDWMIHAHPMMAPVSPYTLTTRIASWRQVFNDTIPWLRLERNYSELALLDALLIVTAWWAFQRRPLTPR
jgi:ABC-type transport system involved in multi-copper enzyme maturation permease subunit